MDSRHDRDAVAGSRRTSEAELEQAVQRWWRVPLHQRREERVVATRPVDQDRAPQQRGDAGVVGATFDECAHVRQVRRLRRAVRVPIDAPALAKDESSRDDRVQRGNGDFIECKYVTVKPAGQWNHASIVFRNGKLEQWLNYRKVVEVQMFENGKPTKQWLDLIAASKFPKIPAPDFGLQTKGRMALQDHGNLVWFKNLKVRKL